MILWQYILVVIVLSLAIVWVEKQLDKRRYLKQAKKNPTKPRFQIKDAFVEVDSVDMSPYVESVEITLAEPKWSDLAKGIVLHRQLQAGL